MKLDVLRFPADSAKACLEDVVLEIWQACAVCGGSEPVMRGMGPVPPRKAYAKLSFVVGSLRTCRSGNKVSPAGGAAQAAGFTEQREKVPAEGLQRQQRESFALHL